MLLLYLHEKRKFMAIVTILCIFNKKKKKVKMTLHGGEYILGGKHIVFNFLLISRLLRLVWISWIIINLFIIYAAFLSGRLQWSYFHIEKEIAHPIFARVTLKYTPLKGLYVICTQYVLYIWPHHSGVICLTGQQIVPI